MIINALRDKTITQVALHDLSVRGIGMKNSKKYNLPDFYCETISSVAVPELEPFPSIVIDARAIRTLVC